MVRVNCMIIASVVRLDLCTSPFWFASFDFLWFVFLSTLLFLQFLCCFIGNLIAQFAYPGDTYRFLMLLSAVDCE